MGSSRSTPLPGVLMLLGLAACQDPASIASPSEDPAAAPPGISLSLSSTPSFSGAAFFGGGGDQYGTAVAANAAGVHVAGYQHPTLGGILLQYTDPPGAAPTWSAAQLGTVFTALALHATTVYPIGYANPPVCGATDGVGGTEGKTMLARYTLAGGSIGCRSHNWFPYTGHENWYGGLGVVESGTPVVYATGFAELRPCSRPGSTGCPRIQSAAPGRPAPGESRRPHR